MVDSGVSSADRVSVIIVTWNSGKVLENCLDSVAKVYGTRLEIVVVDNGNSREIPMQSMCQVRRMSGLRAAITSG